jgi:predicted RNase H-like HicB family nuclease
MKYVLVIEKAGGNLSAWFPDVLGCGTTGSTVDETIRNAHQALSLHLEDETEMPSARPLKAILDEGLELDGDEVFATVDYEQPQHAEH